jgi:ClpP class serine protease
VTTHKLIKFTQALYSKPHLISQAGFNAVSHYLSLRNKSSLMSFGEDSVETEQEDADDLDDFDPKSGVGVINVEGALTYKSVQGMCGTVGCSYEQLLEDTEDMIELGAKIIVFNIDSGGGEGYAMMETADTIRSMCDTAGVKIYAYNDGCMASAAYGLGCIADEVISNPEAESGSIGVLVCLINDSQHLEQEGYTRSFIFAGDSKVPFAEDGTWRKGFLQDIQSKVDTLYGKFTDHVSKYTDLDTKVIRGFEAQMFSASDALDKGLINSIMTRAEFVRYIVDKQKGVANA